MNWVEHPGHPAKQILELRCFRTGLTGNPDTARAHQFRAVWDRHRSTGLGGSCTAAQRGAQMKPASVLCRLSRACQRGLDVPDGVAAKPWRE